MNFFVERLRPRDRASAVLTIRRVPAAPAGFVGRIDAAIASVRASAALLAGRGSLPVVGLLLALSGLAGDAAASCRFRSLEAELERSTRVYSATLVLGELVDDGIPDDYDPESDTQLIAGYRYRFELDVDEVFKGDVPPRVEMHVDTSITIISGSPLRLEDQPLGARLLMFEPGWKGGCSRSGKIDGIESHDLMSELRRLSGKDVSK